MEKEILNILKNYFLDFENVCFYVNSIKEWFLKHKKTDASNLPNLNQTVTKLFRLTYQENLKVIFIL